MEENNRLRALMASSAHKLDETKKRVFAEKYQQIAQAEADMGMSVDSDLLQVTAATTEFAAAAAEFSRAETERAASRGPAVATTVVDPVGARAPPAHAPQQQQSHAPEPPPPVAGTPAPTTSAPPAASTGAASPGSRAGGSATVGSSAGGDGSARGGARSTPSASTSSSSASASAAGKVDNGAPDAPEPATPGTSPIASEEIDSVAYLQDIVNLSVDLDDDSDKDDHPVFSARDVPAFASKGAPVEAARAFAASVVETPGSPLSVARMPRTTSDAGVPPPPTVRTSENVAAEGSAPPSAAELDTVAEPEVVDEEQEARRAERAAARELVCTHVAAEVVADKHSWMLVTVPEAPVAGEAFVVYFNRNASDGLRNRPRIQLKYSFNAWQRQADGGVDSVDLTPSTAPRLEGSDYWVATIRVPEDTYEMNFVLNDGEAAFENNGGMDFMCPVIGGITIEQWKQAAADRACAAAAAAAAAEAEAQAEERRRRTAALLQADKDKAASMAGDLMKNYESLRAGGTATGVPGVWKVSSPAVAGGGSVNLMYNRLGSVLKRLQLPEGATLTLRSGINAWQQPSVVQMQRHTEEASDFALDLEDEAFALDFDVAAAAEAEAALAVAAGATPAAAAAAAAAKVAVAAQAAAAHKASAAAKKAAAAAAAKASAAAAAATAEPAEWWAATLNVSAAAACINFVVNWEGHYDNNDRKDYKLLVLLPPGQTLQSWGNGLAEAYFDTLYGARMAAEAEARERDIVRKAKREEAMALVQAVERRKVRHVLYTEPEVVTAGQDVTVYYNPAETPLAGRSKVYLRGSWNRWNHALGFGPLLMDPPTPSSSESHFTATVTVPRDAFKMDFVFSDVAEGEGTYDTRGGFDYHLPVSGSAVREPSLYIAHIAVEMAPIAKVGGLADVVTALGRAVKDLGHQVEVILPKYQFLNGNPMLQGQMKFETEFEWGGTRIFVTSAEVEGLRVFFIEPRNSFFDTQTVYGRYDDEVRFDFFCKAALEFLLRTKRQPDIVHCHDWSTAYVAKTYWEDYHPFGLWKPKVVFTIHNMNYGKAKLSQAAQYCQKFTTVSPTYALEVGGNPVVAGHHNKFLGVRNGIDNDLWDPANNPFLPVPFNSDNVVEGKRAARKLLRERVGLGGWGDDKLVVGVVSRLTPQKGVPLIKHTAHRTVERGGQFVLLGSAPDPVVQEEFGQLASSYNGDVARFCFKYDEPLSHLIYAACDIIVVPSMFEPCGLTQMIAMRYGAVPVVRHTGGLKDTVFDVDFDKGRAAWEIYGSTTAADGESSTNGFAFEGTDEGALDYALNRAIDAWYNDKEWFHGLQKRIMEQDWSWNRPALNYIELYHNAKKA
ncbi:hypothetical protein FOA52_012880 [Chlamydomonas sp. UWO 241]|nr:hypothetical protein FOA52_012880 [Chlamydomonas sp. UWO 241]